MAGKGRRSSATAAVVGAGSLALLLGGLGSTGMATGAVVDYAVNGTFATGTTGWHLSTKGALSWVSSGQFARVTNNQSAATTVTLNDTANSVNAAKQGTTYSAAASVRSSNTASQEVFLRVQEWATVNGSWQMVNQARSTALLTSASTWRPLTLNYTAQREGSTLDLNVVGSRAPARATVDIDNVSLRATLNDAPTASFVTAADGLTASLDGRGSVDPDGTIASYQWEFGDGATGSGVTPTHRYAASGTYLVALTVTDNSGAKASTTRSVTVVKPNESPVAAFAADPQGLTLSVDGSDSTDSDGTVATHEWDFGDGATATGVRASHQYAAGGTYSVKLTVTDDKGAGNSTLQEVTVTKPNQPPNAAFTDQSDGLTASVDASSSSDPDGSIASYAWDFGDGGQGSGANGSHTYALGGTYPVTLTVTDDRGDTASATRQVTVVKPNQAPVAAFQATVNTLTASVDATASSDPDGTIASYRWEFGDGKTATGVSAVNTYATAGAYTVKLTVVDDKGASASATRQVTATAPAPAGWRLVGGDEFDGQSLNASNWKAYYNTYGDGNAELACLTPNNVGVAGGQATITAKKENITCPGQPADKYSSGFLGSREVGRLYPLYGRFEIRAKMPHGQGLWPAFWLRHRNGSGVAEVDIMEYFHNQKPGSIYQTLHFPTTFGRNLGQKATFVETPSVGTGGWHTYAVEIEPVTATDGTTDVRFRFFVDSVQTTQYVNTAPEAWNQTDPQASWDIAVNLAVGGNWIGDPETNLGYLAGPKVCSLTYKAPTGGIPSNCPTTGIQFGSWPATYAIDYVRVFAR